MLQIINLGFHAIEIGGFGTAIAMMISVMTIIVIGIAWLVVSPLAALVLGNLLKSAARNYPAVPEAVPVRRTPIPGRRHEIAA